MRYEISLKSIQALPSHFMKPIQGIVPVILLLIGMIQACAPDVKITPVAFTPNETTVSLPGLPESATPLRIILVPHGTFLMGSPMEERGRWGDGEWVSHPVTITRDYYLGKYEVTQAQWEAVMGENPSYFKDHPNHPVEEVSWSDCLVFCNRLSEKTGLQPVYDEANGHADWNANGFRLPTEAEWEYACRSGTTTRYSYGDALDSGDECQSSEEHARFMWWCGNNDPEGTKPIGQKLPNPWGFYDMHGNVWEWCFDGWELPYGRGPQVDPRGKNGTPFKVLRGGGWFVIAAVCRSANRGWDGPYYKDHVLGLRICRTKWEADILSASNPEGIERE